jgi:hypothetical protein
MLATFCFVANASRQLFVNFSASQPSITRIRSKEKAL